MSHVLAFGMPSMGEWVVIAALGLLFFGKRLPEVGRSLGKGIVEFKKGLKGIEDDIDDQVDAAAAKQQQPRLPTDQPKPRFDPYTGKPIVEPGHKFDPYTGKPIDPEQVEAGTADTSDSSGAHQG
jgi:sec-independent protein translocase protein TatA